jgi:MFS family permease
MCCACLSARRTLLLLLWLCNVCLYIARTNISVAVVYMFPSDDKIEGRLLSSFYIGYTVSQIPGGWLAARFGAKRVLGSAVLLWSLATIGAGFTDKSAVSVLFLLRVLVGLAEGANYPSQVELLSRFVPYDERSRAWSFIITGEAVGTIAALLGGPFLAHSLGWQSIFYVSGGASLVWLVLFLALVYSSPERHPCIAKEELALIRKSRPPPNRARSTPWCNILTNRHFVLLVCVHCCYNFGYYVCLSWISKFFSQAYGVDYSHLGLYSILPYVFLFFITNLTGVIADTMEQKCRCRRKNMSGAVVRKTLNTVGMGGCALFFLLLSYQVPPAAVTPPPAAPSPSSSGNGSALLGRGTMTEVVASTSVAGASTSALLLALAIGSGGVAAGGGYWPTLGDLSPEYSQVLVGISNSIASIPGILGSSLVGNLLATSHNDWGLVFKVAAAIEALGMLIFLCFVTAEDQKFESNTGEPPVEVGGGGGGGPAEGSSSYFYEKDHRVDGAVRVGVDDRALLQHASRTSRSY